MDKKLTAQDPSLRSESSFSPLLGDTGPFAASKSPEEAGRIETLSVAPKDLVPKDDGPLTEYGRLSMVGLQNLDQFFETDRSAVRYLKIDLNGNEWLELFHRELGCPIPSDQPYLAGQDNEEWRLSFKRRFQLTCGEFPLLGRIWNVDGYAWYRREEIEQLRIECRQIKKQSSNETALAALSKLIIACDEVSNLGLGLLLVPD